MRDFIGTGIAETGPNKNVINILRVLVEDRNSTVYIPYNYIAEKKDRSKDPRVKFPAKESGRPMQVVDIQGHKERFNFSVSCLVDVKVQYPENPGPEDEITFQDKKIWRTYSIVRDGELVVDTIVAKLSEQSYNDLRDSGNILSIGDTIVTPNMKYDPEMIYNIKLAGLPIVSYNWARPDALGFADMLYEQQRLSSKMTQIKKYLKENNIKTTTFDNNIYTESIQDYSNTSSGKTVECVTYTVLNRPGYVEPKYETSSLEDYEATNTKLKDLSFRCACIKWAIETAKSNRRSPYEWSDVYQKKSGSSKYYQETVVKIEGQDHLLERCVFSKTV